MSDYTPIPQADLLAMQAREAAASKGPWEAKPLRVYDPPLVIEGGEGRTEECDGLPAQVLRHWTTERGRHTQFLADVHQTHGRKDSQSSDDAEFMAHARRDQPRLRIALQAAQAEIERLREGLREAKIGKLRAGPSSFLLINRWGEDITLSEHNACIDALLGGEGKKVSDG